MTQSHRGKGAWIRLAATLPVIAAAFFAFGCGTKEAKASTDFSTDFTTGTEPAYLTMYPPCDASVSNSFGAKTDASGAASHQGIDYVLNEGDPVYAAADGEICNGKLCKINEEIGEAVSRYFAGIDDPEYATIHLEADNDVPEAVLAKVSEQLRKAQALKGSKTVTESNPGEIVVLKDATRTASTIANGALIDVIYDPDGSRIYIDGVRHSLDEVAEVIGAKRDLSDKPHDFTVHIKASGDTRMGIITDIKKELRTINGIRLLYTLDEMVTPDNPYPETEIAPYYKVETYKESRNNIIVIKTNASDRYLIGDRPDHLDVNALERVKSYILNKENNPDLPDRTDKEFILPDGRIITYPVSKAMILMQNDRGTNFEGYQAVNAFVQKAYSELRNDLAAELFGRPLAELSDEEMSIIRQAIPMNVCEAEPKDVPARR